MISEIIKNRRAVYPVQYNEHPSLKEEIEKILKSAKWSPTHRRTEPWRFKVFHGESQKTFAEFMAKTYKETTDKFAERSYNNMQVNPVILGCVITIRMQRDPTQSVPEWEEIS